MQSNFWASSHYKNWILKESFHESWLGRRYKLNLKEEETLIFCGCKYISEFVKKSEMSDRILEKSLTLFQRCFKQKVLLPYTVFEIGEVCVHLSLLSEGQRHPRIKVTSGDSNSSIDGNDDTDSDGNKKSVWKDFIITNQQCERDILSALNSDLNVFLPVRYLHQFLSDSRVPESFSFQSLLFLHDMMKTPIPLYHTPFIIAIACMHLTSIVLQMDIRTFLGTVDFDVDEMLKIAADFKAFFEDTNIHSREFQEKVLKKVESFYL